MNKDNQMLELVAMLDNLVSAGVGHINVSTTDDQQQLNVETTNSTECNCSQGACCQPTEQPEDA